MKALVLAAGLSRRMRQQKMLLPFGNKNVLGTVLDAVAGGPFTGLVLVVSETVRAALAVDENNCRTVVNPFPESGQSGSLRLGLHELGAGEDFCVMLGDLPLVTSEQLICYARIFLDRDKHFSALVPMRDATPGHPAFFSAVWQKRFLEAQGDVGGRNILRKYAAEIMRVSGEDSFFMDMDTPEEYERLHTIWAKRTTNG